jgi:AcrR family transcriptional regulator
MRPGCRETQSERRRDHIIEVARTLFLETGYDATTMSSIAAKIGGSKSTLWAYFNSKEELLVAVVDVLTRELQGDILNAFRLPDDLPAGLLQFCWRLGDIVQQPDALATLRLVAAESGRSPELGRLYFDRVIDVTRRELAAYLEPFIVRTAEQYSTTVAAG